ncbi:dTDP-4-dehydrorhamnose reductase family protein [Aquicella lusitana]|uniref:dTDP-4-dehydrorhamnose reductase n=1 Tax=Aquicella lusitana TaxID=254246 RepID=A0A370GY06_9COXI|nr:SDR family oxidoreductase [Aquicella lusitana]RDI48166.1 dTDP-4-dehydrorhamnose reductase [Aquicella lusitana]VVC72818.1 dTDP-4-dehydrorhamnose reductase [Aquicella lusitana]
MIKTAVIGASGYIGNHLWRKYRETFPDCIGTGFSQVKQGLTPFDLRNPDSDSLKLEETGHQAVLIASAKPNVGWCESHPKESYELNVLGTLKLVKQLARRSIHVLFFSSDYVFNGETGSYSDKAQTNPITEYGKQKAEVEREIANITDNYTILRLSKIYGTTWKDGTLIDALAADLLKGQKQKVATDQFFSPTHVDDVVSMTLYIQEQGIRGLVNLCNSNSYSRHQIAMKLADALKVSPSLLESIPLHSIPGMEHRPLNTSLICSPSLQKLQPSLMSMDDAIKCTALNWSQEPVACFAEAR